MIPPRKLLGPTVIIWTCFLRQMTWWKKRAIFLTEMGANSFILVNDLLAPRSAKDFGLNEITNEML